MQLFIVDGVGSVVASLTQERAEVELHRSVIANKTTTAATNTVIAAAAAAATATAHGCSRCFVVVVVAAMRCDGATRKRRQCKSSLQRPGRCFASRHMFYRLIRTVMKLMMVRMRMSVTVRMASKMIVEILAMLVV